MARERTAVNRTMTERAARTEPGALETAARIGLTALAVLFALQLIRVFLPIVFDLGERSGTALGAIKAGVLAIVISLTPFLAPLFPRLLRPRKALPAVLLELVSARIAVQLTHPVPLWLATLGMALSLVALSLLLVAMRPRAGGTAGRTFVIGMVVGLALDTALRTAYWTWDLAWHQGAVPLLLVVLPGAGLVFLLLWNARGDLRVVRADGRGSLGALLIGPFLFLQLTFLQNPAFMASSGHVSLPVAAALALLADAIALAALLAQPPTRSAARWALGAGLVLLATFPRHAHGLPLVVAVLVAQALAAWFLAVGLSSHRPLGQTAVWRTTSAFALGSVGLMLLLFLYQVVYRVKLPLPNTVLAPVAALVLALGGVGFRRSAMGAQPARLGLIFAIPLALLLVPLGTALARSTPETEEGNGRSFVLVSYNVHLGIDASGQVNPEAVARVIESQRPDVVALQEVPRGWLGAGGIDLAQWMSQRLRMPYAYAPAADEQFGNLVLSRLPIRGWEGMILPRVSAPMRRSYLKAVIDLGRGRSVTVIDAHLEGGQPDHRVQVEGVLRGWGEAPHTVIAGDMNMQPADPDRAMFEAAGLISAQDRAGLGNATTATHPKFNGDRVDWIFGTGDLSFSRFRITAASPSDHRPLTVTVTVL